MRALALTLAVGGILALLVATAYRDAPSTRAEFPGQNGSIAFEGTRDSATFDVYVYNGGTVTNLTNNPTNPSKLSANPAWSPDGTKVAYTHDGDIHVMNANGSSPTPLTSSGGDFNPDWSPDGTKIVFENATSGSDIYVMNANGTGATNITSTAGVFDQAPSWAPDGSKIAFSTNRDGNFEIYTMDPNGNNPTRLTNNTGNDREPDWSPDSAKLVFARSGIRTMNADGSGETFVAGGQMPVWSPDGAKIAFNLNNGHLRDEHRRQRPD